MTERRIHVAGSLISQSGRPVPLRWKIFEQRYADMKASDRRSLPIDPLAEIHTPLERDNSLEQLWDMEHTVKSQAPSIETFSFRLQPATWTECGASEGQEYISFRTHRNGIVIYLSVRSTSEFCTFQGRKKGEAQFLLLAGYLDLNGNDDEEEGKGNGVFIQQYLMMLKSKPGGVFERNCIIVMEVPRTDLWVLKHLGLGRTRVLLV